MDWFYLCGAGVLEVAGAILLKKLAERANRAANARPSENRRISISLLLSLVLSLGSSLYLLALAARSIPIGIAYSVWTGIGSVGSVVAGIFLFKEKYHAIKLVCLFLMIIGIIGLRATA